MEYLIDVLKETLTEQEANKYYEKSVVDMDEKNSRIYLENEKKYLLFFKKLFFLNGGEVNFKINSFYSCDIDEFFDSEKEKFLKEIVNIGLDSIMLKKEKEIKNFDEIISFIKLSYRDYLAGSGRIELTYKNIKLKIISNSDYTYIMEIPSKFLSEIEKVAKLHEIYIKKIN